MAKYEIDATNTEFEQEEAGRSKLANYNLGVGDSWVKAITEIVTNSHQNYHDNWNELNLDDQTEKPAICIIANPDKEIFTLIDNGTGIARDMNELEGLLKKYSQFIPKSHTTTGRSSFGRGLSDVLFRRGIYTNQILSHKDGKCLAVYALWKTEINQRAPIFRIDNQISDNKIRSLIPQHGTQVTFHWASKHEKRNFPSKKEMLDRLSQYYELKNVLNDKKVDVFLLYLDGKKNPDIKKLEFVNYQKNAEPIGKTLSDIPLPIAEDYDIRIISARIWKTKNAVLNQEKGELRTGGLFIEGEYGQIFDLTLFDQERSYRDVSLRIIGEVILSKDAKRYMDNFYTEQGITILTRTREGFDKKFTFYKELKKKLGPWLEQILESESDSSQSTSSEQFKEAIRRLNEIGKKLLEAKNLETQPKEEEPGEEPQQPQHKLPDTIEFSPESPEIEQGVLSKIFLKINCEKIRPGTKITSSVGGLDRTHFEIDWETNKVPNPNKNGLAKIPILVKCNELSATAEIIAQTQKKNDELTGEKYCLLKCVEEKDSPDRPELTEYLEFVPKKTKVDTNIDKRVNIMAHQILEPGTKIKIEFTCETHDFDLPITFAEDDNRKIAGLPYSFEVEVPNVPLEENAYRKVPLTFIGTGEGLRGKITASSEHESTIPTMCEIEIESIPESGGGLLSGWDIRDVDYLKFAWYSPKDTKVIINVRVPFVRKILGKNKDEADDRCAKFQEAQVFVAQTMMDVFFDEIVLRMLETRKLFIDIDNPTERDIHEFLIYEKQRIMQVYGENILSIFAPHLRTKTIGGVVKTMNFIKEGLEFRYWDFDLQQNVIPPISFNEFHQFRGKSANLSTVHFEVNGQEFEVAVYQFDGDEFVATLHDYDKDGKYKAVMPEIDRFKQIFKTPKKTSSMITLDEPVFSAVEIADWVGQPEHRIRLVPLRYDQYYEIPDAPEMNHSNVIIESSPNWDSMGEQAIQYAKFSDIFPNFEDDTLKNKLVCIVSKLKTTQMAKIFVRTKVVPAFESFNVGAKAFNDIIIHCQGNTCDTEASNFSEILTKFGFHFEDKKPHVNLLCKNCV